MEVTGWRIGFGCYVLLPLGVVFFPEEWRTAEIVPLHKAKGERTEYEKYRGFSLLSVIGKIYAGI